MGLGRQRAEGIDGGRYLPRHVQDTYVTSGLRTVLVCHVAVSRKARNAYMNKVGSYVDELRTRLTSRVARRAWMREWLGTYVSQ